MAAVLPMLALAAASCFFVSADAIAVRAPPQMRPNILFLMTDSMDGRVVDPAAPEAEAVDMPFLRDILGKKGANFVRSYSNSPMCVPSRTSMMTGRAVSTINVWGNRMGLAASPAGVLDERCVAVNGEELCKKWAKEQGYPETVFSAFKKLGYKVHMDGRIHIGAGMLNKEDHDGKIDGFQTCDAFDTFRAGEITRSADIRKSAPANQRAIYLEKASLDRGDSSFAMADWTATNGCVRFLNQLPSPEDATEPFFLHCSLNLPHFSYSTNSTWLQSVHTDKLKLPTWNKGFPEKWHPYDSFMSTIKGVDIDFKEEDIFKLQRVYYGMVAESDAMLGKIWDALTSKGYSLDNTYVLFVSDHGEMRFEHRQVMKASMYEASARVPFQIAGPGIKAGQRIDDRLASLLDVFPTLLDMARESDWTSHKGLEGQSLLAAAGGSSVAPKEFRMDAHKDSRDFVFSQYNWVEANTGAYMVRSGPWKYIAYGHTYSAYNGYEPQLFNVEEDPEELSNVALENPLVIKRLDARLRKQFDPDEVDRWVAQDDFERLKSRFVEDPDPQKGILMTVHGEDSLKFQAWLREAERLFGPFADNSTAATPAAAASRMAGQRRQQQRNRLGR